MTEIPPKTIESPLDPIADLGTLEARGTADSTTPKASETMDPVLLELNSSAVGQYWSSASSS